MIHPNHELDALHRSHVRTYVAPLDYRSALVRFVRLWAYARKVRPDFTEDWVTDVQADIELARVLNDRSD